jgi:hypothetical protein
MEVIFTIATRIVSLDCVSLNLLIVLSLKSDLLRTLARRARAYLCVCFVGAPFRESI